MAHRPREHAPERASAHRVHRSGAGPGGAGQIEQEPARGRRMGRGGPSRPDSELEQELRARFDNNDAIDASAMDVIVSDAVITLLGTVPEYAMKREVERVCDQVLGVREIHDQLRVDPGEPSTTAGGLRTTAPEPDIYASHAGSGRTAAGDQNPAPSEDDPAEQPNPGDPGPPILEPRRREDPSEDPRIPKPDDEGPRGL